MVLLFSYSSLHPPFAVDPPLLFSIFPLRESPYSLLKKRAWVIFLRGPGEGGDGAPPSAPLLPPSFDVWLSQWLIRWHQAQSSFPLHTSPIREQAFWSSPIRTICSSLELSLRIYPESPATLLPSFTTFPFLNLQRSSSLHLSFSTSEASPTFHSSFHFTSLFNLHAP